MREYRDGVLYVDGVDLRRVVAAVGTPCYVYSRGQIESNWRAYDRAFGARSHRVHYAVKANDNLSIIRLLQQLCYGIGRVIQQTDGRAERRGDRAVPVRGAARDGRHLIPAESGARRCEQVRTGDNLVIDIAAGTLTNTTTGDGWALLPLGEVASVLEAGGLFPYARMKATLAADERG